MHDLTLKRYHRMSVHKNLSHPSFTMTHLTPAFGVELHDVDLTALCDAQSFAPLREVFEEHSAILIKNQHITDAQHMALGRLFGEIEDRNADIRTPDDPLTVSQVSNICPDGSVTDQSDMHSLHLKSNMLWHADSTFMPRPALTNILIGRVVTSIGGATELASTRAAWADMPEEKKEKIRGRGVWHRYSHSRAKISKELASLPMFHKWDDQHWRSTWTNPKNGKDALYLASHAYAVDGYDEDDGAKLIDEMIDFCTQEDYVYRHQWQEDDVLIWDQRAVLHRGTPWPENEPRKLSSICVSASDEDGLNSLRMDA